MRIYQINPTEDPRWAELVERHPKASVFHTVGWLRALRRTYGYEPVVFTTSSPTGELRTGWSFVELRAVASLDVVSSRCHFQIHCQPLCDSAEDLDFLLRYLQTVVETADLHIWKSDQSLEPCPVLTAHGASCQQRSTSCTFSTSTRISKRCSAALTRILFSVGFARAEGAGLVEKCGRSEDLLKDFYSLFALARSRHRLPPTPYAWFRNLDKCQDKALDVRVAYKDQTPISAILTLRFKDSLYYKYGGSDARFNNLGATPWLLWRAIAAAKSNGARKFDLGRSEEDNQGLLRFKNHWVREPQHLMYWRFPESSLPDAFSGWKLRFAKQIFSCMPDRLLTIAGNLIYRHIG